MTDDERVAQIRHDWRMSTQHGAGGDIAFLLRLLDRERQDARNARCIGRVLAHAYEHDSRPPPHMVKEALGWPVDGRTP